MRRVCAFRRIVACLALAAALSGCGERPGPALAPEGVKPEKKQAEVPQEGPEAAARPSLASVRDLGVKKEPAADPTKGLSAHARSFYKELDEIERGIRILEPRDPFVRDAGERGRGRRAPPVKVLGSL